MDIEMIDGVEKKLTKNIGISKSKTVRFRQ